MTSRFAFVLVLCLACVAIGFAVEPAKKADPAKETGFEAKLLEHVKDYKGYELVDGTGRWAPILCAAPSGPPDAHFSKSSDEKTHGNKLYLMYARIVKKGVYVTNEPGSSRPGHRQGIVEAGSLHRRGVERKGIV